MFKRFLEVDSKIESIKNELEGVENEVSPAEDENGSESEHPLLGGDYISHVTDDNSHKASHVTNHADSLQFSEFSDSSDSEGSPDDRDTPIYTPLLSQPLPSPPIASTPINLSNQGLLSQPMLPLPLPPRLCPAPFMSTYSFGQPVRSIPVHSTTLYSPLVRPQLGGRGKPSHLLPLPHHPGQVFQQFGPRPRPVSQRPLLNFGGFKNVI